MFEDFFNDTCNIYHTEDCEITVGYGIDAGSVKAPGTDISVEGVACHFHRKNTSIRVVQEEPHSAVSGETKLSLPIGTDIRVNDIVENCSSGIRYRAGIPKEIYGAHHIIVTLQLEGGTRTPL